MKYSVLVNGEQRAVDVPGADAPALGAPGRHGPEGHQVRLRCGPVRRLHGAARRPAHSLVHHADLLGRQGRGHHHREPAARRVAPAAARLAGTRRAAVRLLPGGPAHGRLGAPQGHAEPDRCADRRGDERQRLPLRHLRADQAGHQVGGRAPGGGPSHGGNPEGSGPRSARVPADLGGGRRRTAHRPLRTRRRRAGAPGWPRRVRGVARAEHLHHGAPRQHLHHHLEEPGDRAGHQDRAAAGHRRRVRRRLGAGQDPAGRPRPEVRRAVRGRQPRDSLELPEHAAGGRGRPARHAGCGRAAVGRPARAS